MTDIRTAAERIRAGADRARQKGFPKVAASFEDEAEYILAKFDDLAAKADDLPGSLLAEVDVDTRSNPVVQVTNDEPRSIYARPLEDYR